MEITIQPAFKRFREATNVLSINSAIDTAAKPLAIQNRCVEEWANRAFELARNLSFLNLSRR